MNKLALRSASTPRPIRAGIAGVLREMLPPTERAHELSELTTSERRDLYRLAGLDAVTARRYEHALRGHSGRLRQIGALLHAPLDA